MTSWLNTHTHTTRKPDAGESDRNVKVFQAILSGGILSETLHLKGRSRGNDEAQGRFLKQKGQRQLLELLLASPDLCLFEIFLNLI